MRTLVAVEARPNETVTEDGQHLEEWVQYADNPRSLVEDNPGAVRSAISPWLAHKVLTFDVAQQFFWGSGRILLDRSK